VRVDALDLDLGRGHLDQVVLAVGAVLRREAGACAAMAASTGPSPPARCRRCDEGDQAGGRFGVDLSTERGCSPWIIAA
jgi:hypothetical protein